MAETAESPRPMDLAAFCAAAAAFSGKLREIKREHPLERHGWYPYESLTAISILERLLERDFALLPPLWSAEPVLDAGCADGDLAFFFESLGATVDAVDYSEMNFNQLEGARALRQHLASSAGIHSINLDWYFEFPRRSYGLVLFLGTLYHLKNPFYVLETLARHGAYCLLSTRIAAETRRGGVPIAGEPVAYLLDPREANDDPTNYWIFSEAGLLRLLDRSGWSVLASHRAGCAEGSNPVDADADERIFLLLESRVRFPDVRVRLLDGWHAPEEGGWRWTAKEFAFEVVLPRRRPAKEFALAVHLPEGMESAELSCRVNDRDIPPVTFRFPGPHTFRGVFPEGTGGRVLLQFGVRHDYRPAPADRRELGVLVSFADPLAGARTGLPFRVS
jgi:SAM-dependent methyltransferase